MHEASLTVFNVTRNNTAPWLPGCKGKKSENAKMNSVNINKKVNTPVYSNQTFRSHMVAWVSGKLVFFSGCSHPFTYSLFSFNVFLVPAVFYFSCRNFY